MIISKTILKSLFLGSIIFFMACNSQAQKNLAPSKKVKNTIDKIQKSEKEWESELTEMEYFVLRKKGTERSFSGALWDNKKEGIYTCAACELPLFDSDSKFVSGTGWPSFFKPIKDENITEDVDYKIGYKRVEILCARCEGHLGHVFSDGPKPTGLRYCMNSVSLNFQKKKD
ncbi:MAG: peptide-methionine (R)-S-oxide reductase MsrB [Saprospiraceae bacterium]